MTGHVWRADVTLEMRRRLDKFLIRIADGLPHKDRQRILSRKFADNVEALCRSRMACKASDFDNEPHVLNTKGGAIDLRNGDVLPYRDDSGHPLRMHMKITRYKPIEGPMPLWMSFLETITAGDEERIRFLQRCAGYWATGLIKEQKIFFLWGTGANGKSVFLSTLAHVLGDYAIAAPVELLLRTRNERHETEKAWLMGARLVRMNEPSEGEHWHEGKLKELTGEEMIAARFTMGNYFEFGLQCKFVISGNNEPSFAQVDEAIRRRFVLVPFQVEIPERERDTDLYDKLKSEGNSILW